MRLTSVAGEMTSIGAIVRFIKQMILLVAGVLKKKQNHQNSVSNCRFELLTQDMIWLSAVLFR